VKVTSGIDTAHLIPSNDMTKTFANLQVAVGANPCFAIVCIGTDAGLSCVFHSALDFATT
jgi:hypothetical protein